MQLKDAVGSFFVEFSRFETHYVGMALRSLSRDSLFVDHAERLLDLEARLKLLERMAFAREVPAGLMTELEACMLHARKLREHRDDVVRGLTSTDRPRSWLPPAAAGKSRLSRRRNADYSRLAELENLWAPDLGRVREYVEETLELQQTLRAVTQKLEHHLNPIAEAG